MVSWLSEVREHLESQTERQNIITTLIQMACSITGAQLIPPSLALALQQTHILHDVSGDTMTDHDLKMRPCLT